MIYILVVLMLISLSILLYFTYKPYKNFRGIFKTLTSILFVSIALVGYILNNSNFTYFLLMLLGLIFSLFGDAFLIFEKGESSSMSKAFIYGVLSFSLAHIFFSAGFIYLSSFKLYTIGIAFLLSFITLLILKSIKNVNFKGSFSYIVFYAFVISFMFSQSINLYFTGHFNNFYTIWITIGALLFVLSDLILSFNYFYKNCPKFMGVLNLLVYYIAQLLLALSVAYI
ncbi:lysoplasmalogenase [Paraclostridium sordellii]|uniref:lysoplasmalogenase n=1 Tax=Paraclostridium sordellii TaxID=1505 RepID=UPI0005DAC922|nr:lysoplasmalogenase [Paeniclostridium sordellii]CEN25092.1 YhhN-like protein [[Clostridium] sordellii] [Paeniclostridium sordellii]